MKRWGRGGGGALESAGSVLFEAVMQQGSRMATDKCFGLVVCVYVVSKELLRRTLGICS